jgi:hypothetical protein
MSPADVSTADVAIYYHAPEKVHLLHHAVFPAAHRARAAGLLVHVERHWRHGPHLRLRLTGPPHRIANLTDEQAQAIREELRSRPSTTAVSAEVFLRRAVAWGRVELVAGPYEPIYPDNTVRIEPPDDDRVLRLLGSRAAVDCRAELLRCGMDAASASASSLVAAGNTPAARVGLAVLMMTVHACGYPLGPAGGYQSFLSHLEDFLHRGDPAGAVRARFDRAWRRQSRQVIERVGSIIDDGCRGEPLVRAWRGWTRSAWAHCVAAAERGELGLPGDEYRQEARRIGDAAAQLRWDPLRRTDYSEYHRALAEVDFLGLPGVAEHFRPYRFATNVLYLLLALCDVTPMERYQAAYLLSRSMEQITGVDWRASLAPHLDPTGGGTP